MIRNAVVFGNPICSSEPFIKKLCKAICYNFREKLVSVREKANLATFFFFTLLCRRTYLTSVKNRPDLTMRAFQSSCLPVFSFGRLRSVVRWWALLANILFASVIAAILTPFVPLASAVRVNVTLLGFPFKFGSEVTHHDCTGGVHRIDSSPSSTWSSWLSVMRVWSWTTWWFCWNQAGGGELNLGNDLRGRHFLLPTGVRLHSLLLILHPKNSASIPPFHVKLHLSRAVKIRKYDSCNIFYECSVVYFF